MVISVTEHRINNPPWGVDGANFFICREVVFGVVMGCNFTLIGWWFSFDLVSVKIDGFITFPKSLPMFA